MFKYYFLQVCWRNWSSSRSASPWASPVSPLPSTRQTSSKRRHKRSEAETALKQLAPKLYYRLEIVSGRQYCLDTALELSIGAEIVLILTCNCQLVPRMSWYSLDITTTFFFQPWDCQSLYNLDVASGRSQFLVTTLRLLMSAHTVNLNS